MFFWGMINVIVSEAGKSSFTLWRILDILNRHHTKETINIKIFLFNKPIKRINVAFPLFGGIVTFSGKFNCCVSHVDCLSYLVVVELIIIVRLWERSCIVEL